MKDVKAVTLDRIRDVIVKVCEVCPEEVCLQARLRGYGIDSVRVLDLLMSIEEEFGIDLNLEEVSRIATVRELAEYIDRQPLRK